MSLGNDMLGLAVQLPAAADNNRIARTLSRCEKEELGGTREYTQVATDQALAHLCCYVSSCLPTRMADELGETSLGDNVTVKYFDVSLFVQGVPPRSSAPSKWVALIETWVIQPAE